MGLGVVLTDGRGAGLAPPAGGFLLRIQRPRGEARRARGEVLTRTTRDQFKVTSGTRICGNSIAAHAALLVDGETFRVVACATEAAAHVTATFQLVRAPQRAQVFGQ